MYINVFQKTESDESLNFKSRWLFSRLLEETDLIIPFFPLIQSPEIIVLNPKAAQALALVRTVLVDTHHLQN